MLSRLFTDAFSCLLFRFRSANEYRYSIISVWVAFLAIVLVRAASLNVFFAAGSAILPIAFIIEALNIIIFASLMRRFLGLDRTVSLAGYVFVLELLTLPTLLVIYSPIFTPLISLFQLWALIAGLKGFQTFSQKSLLRVVIGYILATIAVQILSSTVITIFAQQGWIDIIPLMEKMRETFPTMNI